MIDEVGVVERQLTRDEKLVVDLERVGTEVVGQHVELGAVDDGTPNPATVVPAGIAATAKTPMPFSPAGRRAASGLSHDWRTGTSV